MRCDSDHIAIEGYTKNGVIVRCENSHQYTINKRSIATGKSNKVWIYLATPFTKGDQLLNIRSSLLMAERLRRINNTLHIIAPLAMAFSHLVFPNETEHWLEYDLEMLRRCEALFVADAKHFSYRQRWQDSVGVCGEIAEATSLGIPIFYEINDLKIWIEK